MRRSVVFFAVFMALAAACSSPRPERSSFTIPPPDTTSSPVSTTSTTAAAPALPAGRLVVVDNDGGIVSMRPDGSGVATIAEASAETFVLQPQWSPGGGRIAWGQIGPGGASLEISDGDGSNRTSTETANLPYYISWAPDGSRLIGLYNGAAGGVEARHVDAADGSTTVLGNEVPYYFSWDPDSSRLAAHLGPTSLEIVELDGSSRSLAEASPLFQAPIWTPAGIFHLTEAGISLDDGTGNAELVARVPGAVFFTANGAGTKLAVEPVVAESSGASVAFQDVPTLLPNVVSVLDIATGAVEVATDVAAAAFFWSPDGGSLAVLADGDGPGRLRWVVWHGGEQVELAEFTPAPSFIQNVLPFASQYALSLNLWAPGSDAVAFVGRIGSRQGVWVQPTDGTDPIFVTDGEWVAWSHE